ncbi:MAG: tungstate ABC transporter substrate-binding protein WtpA [Thermoplasmata archaeon]
MNLRTLRMVVTLAVCAAVIVSAVGLYLVSTGNRWTVVLKVYTAGSLAEPFDNMPEGEDLETLFEGSHHGVDVQVTSGGSADMIRRITGLHQTCDVLAVADYSLIPSMMINATPKTAGFSIQFAKNSMVIAYTNRSAHHEELTADNWFNILRMPDVKFGFSNPNDDPAGYRAQMVMLLAQMHYGDWNIYEDLVLDNTNMLGVTHDASNGTYTVEVPSVLTVTETDRVVVRSAEVDLTSALEFGSIDYLFIYESVARRHASSGERYLELPAQINLNDTAFASLYSKVRVRQFADSTNASKIKIVNGSPIVYGVTIPGTSEHPDLAAEFVAMLLGETGQEVMEEAGQEPIVPACAGYWKPEVPDALQQLVV